MSQNTQRKNQFMPKKDIYATDPPLDKQVQSIRQSFNNLISIINDNIQTYNNDDNEEDFFLKNKNQTKKNKDSNVNSIAIDLKPSIHKLYVDAVKSLRYAQKHEQGENIQYGKSYLLEQFKELQSNLHNLRMEMVNLLQETIRNKGNKLSNSLLFDYENLIDEIMTQFCEDLYDIYLKMLQYNDPDFSTSIFNSLFDGIFDFSEEMERMHLELIQNIEWLPYPTNLTANFINNCPEFSNDNPQTEKSTQKLYSLRKEKLTEFFTDQINLHLVDFQKAVNNIHQMHKSLHDFISRFHDQLSKSGPRADLIDLERVYQPRCDGFCNICNFFSNLGQNRNRQPLLDTSDASEEEDMDSSSTASRSVDPELLWEKVRRERCTEFAAAELQFAGETLQDDLTLAWHASPDPGVQAAVGSLLYATFNARFEAKDASLVLADVASAYMLAVRGEQTQPQHVKRQEKKVKGNEEEEEEADDESDAVGEDEEDLQLAANFQSLLEGMIDAACSDLMALRNRQVRFLSNPPGADTDEYVRRARLLCEDVQKRTLDLNAALCRAREADFIISQRAMLEATAGKHNANKNGHTNERDSEDSDGYGGYSDSEASKEDEDDAFIDYADNFQSYAIDESTAIKRQLDKIISIIDSVFSVARGISGSEKLRITKSMKMSIQPQMSSSSLLQATCAEDAMAATYIQLFESTKGILVALIRTSNFDQAVRVKEETLSDNIKGLLNHLESSRKRAKARNDVQTIKTIDERIAYLKEAEEGDIKGCICESLRNVIDVTIANFDWNVKLIDDQCNAKVAKLKERFLEHVDVVQKDKHIPDLILIEKKRIIAEKKQMQRRDMNNYEDEEATIGRYIEGKKYQLAEREKAKLERKKEDAMRRRMEEVKEKYAKMKEMKLDEQKEELKRMEKRFMKKKKSRESEAKRQKSEQTKILVTSMKTSSLRHYQIAQKMLKVDPRMKRDIQRTLNRIVNEALEKRRDVKEMADLLDKGNRTDWVQ